MIASMVMPLLLQTACRPRQGPSAPAGVTQCSKSAQPRQRKTQGKSRGLLRGVRAALALLMGAWAPLSMSAANGGHPRLEAVARDVWRVPANGTEPDERNAGATAQLVLVRDGSKRWLIGSGPTPAYAAALAREVRRVSGAAVSDVIDTRAAPELVLGNAGLPGARVWALAEVRAAMAQRCGHCLAQLKARIGAAGASLRPAAIRLPTHRLVRAAEGHGRLGPFDTLALQRAPGEWTLALRHRASGVVIAQGLVWPGALPELRDTRSDTLLDSLQALRRWAGAAPLLGEQGAPATGDAIDAHRAYLVALRGAIEPLLRQGALPGTPEAAAELPAFAQQPGYAARHALNVQRVWRELEPAVFR